ILIVSIITLGLIGGTSGNQVEASASFGNDHSNQPFVQKETPNYEWNNFQELMKQFTDRHSNNEQNEYGTEPKEETYEQNENVQHEEQNKNEENKVEEQDNNEEKQVEENDNNLHPFEQEVVELTNQEREKKGIELIEIKKKKREKQGLKTLEIDSELSVVSKDKSKDMLNNQYFSHDSPTYGSPFDMMEQYGISYRTAGENIAKGQSSPQEVVDGWMNSPGHRENILNGDFTHIGVGYVEEENVWTQQFIGK